ncbi:MAG: ribbon-helix-helix protein, CopG family [Chloroflexi bacterium]|nr:ribbon-helix-helix protein, CopG family [Chloroflexota bacterium]
MASKSKIIQVPVPEKLLRELDELSEKRGQSRSALIREACAEYMASLEEAEAVQRYIQSYVEMPETEEEKQWGELGAQLAAEVWGEEDWSEEYAADMAERDATR